MAHVKPTKRIWYSLVGLCAGDAALLFFLLQNAIRSRFALLAAHMGEPSRMIPQTVDVFALYAVFSLAGWVVVGLPVAIVVPPRIVARTPWPLAALAGAALGPLALVAILAALAGRHLFAPGGFAHTGWFFALSILVSTVALPVYAALLRRASKQGIAA